MDGFSIIITGAKRFSFDQDGRHLEGTNIFYYPEDLDQTDENSLGHFTEKATIPFLYFDQLKLSGLPCKVVAKFKIVPKKLSNGSTVQAIVINDLDLSSIELI